MTVNKKVKIGLIQFDYFIKNSILKLFVSILFKKKIPTGQLKILIFRNGSIGDSICAIPAITAIREKYAMSEIILLTHSGGFKDISLANIIHIGLVDRIINYENIPYPTLIEQLKGEKINFFILLPQAHASFKKFVKDLLFAKYIKASYVIGFKICVTRVFPKIQAKYLQIPNVSDFLLSIVNTKNIDTNKSYTFAIHIPKEDEDYVHSIFLQKHITLESKTIALTIGAKRPQNRWPIAYFDAVIEFLILNNYTCIIIGGKEDSDLVNKLKTKNNLIDFTGLLSVKQSAMALKKCVLHITNDTGPMHLSYAMGTFVVALFSSRDYPNLWFPPEKNSKVFRNNEIFCSECFSNECNDNRCLKAIHPESIIEFLKIKLKI
jgi:ADP-heptose:LPS heptosyltransferase